MNFFSPRKPSPLMLIFFVVLTHLVGFGLVIPLLPYYAASFNAAPWQVGLLFSIFPIGQAVSGPFWGRMSDRFGRRPVLLAGLAGAAISFFWLAAAKSWFGLLFARGVDGLAGGSIVTARAYISDSTHEKERVRGFGFLGAAFGLGFILGPLLAGWLSSFGYRFIALFAGFFSCTALALAAGFLPESLPKERRAIRTKEGWFEVYRRVWKWLRHSVTGKVLLLDFGFWSVYASYQALFAAFVQTIFDFSLSQAAHFLALSGAVGVFMQVLVVPRLARFFKEPSLLSFGLGLGGFSTVAMAASKNVLEFSLALIALSIGFSMVLPHLVGLLSRQTQADRQGELQGVGTTVEGFGRIIGPMLFYSVASFSPFRWVLAVCGVVVLFLCFLSVCWRINFLPAHQRAAQ